MTDLLTDEGRMEYEDIISKQEKLINSYKEGKMKKEDFNKEAEFLQAEIIDRLSRINNKIIKIDDKKLEKLKKVNIGR